MVEVMSGITQYKLGESYRRNVTTVDLNDFRIFIKNYVEKYGIPDHLNNSPEFVEEFTKTFGHSDDFFQTDDIVYYYYMRKFIGSDARDYWYDEALHYYDHVNYYAKINDSYFNDVPFDGPDHNKKVEERRRQIENEIGSEQDRLLANYLQKLEDNTVTSVINHRLL